jgi:hypothetical protein
VVGFNVPPYHVFSLEHASPGVCQQRDCKTEITESPRRTGDFASVCSVVGFNVPPYHVFDLDSAPAQAYTSQRGQGNCKESHATTLDGVVV